jgi:hypothetical protein
MAIGDLQAFVDIVLNTIVSGARDRVIVLLAFSLTLTRKQSMSRCNRSNAVGWGYDLPQTSTSFNANG